MTFTHRLVPLIALFSLVQGAASARGDEEQKPEVERPVTIQSLREKQLDLSLEARDVERVIGRLKRASELAKTRITDAAKTTESATAALDRGDQADARKDAQQASEMFEEIIRQLQALLAEETPQQVAQARNLANQLAELERQFAEQFQGAMNVAGGGGGKVDPRSQEQQNKEKSKQGGGDDGSDGKEKGGGGDAKKQPADGKSDPQTKPKPSGGGDDDPDEKVKGGGGGKTQEDPADRKGGGQGKKDAKETGGTGSANKPDDKKQRDRDASGGGPGKKDPPSQKEKLEALIQQADKLEQMGQTLKDVLAAIAKSSEPEDKQAVSRLETILRETGLVQAIDDMKNSADLIRKGKLDDARQASLDMAERLTIAAQRLDATHRAIVAPRTEELRKLEKQIAGLQEKAKDLETQSQVQAFNREVRQVVDTSEKVGISLKAREDLIAQVDSPGTGTGIDKSNWAVINNRYVPPSEYLNALRDVQEEVQTRIQLLVLGDLAASDDEATPPKYQEFVDRYYQVLSEGREGKIPASQSAKKGRNK